MAPRCSVSLAIVLGLFCGSTALWAQSDRLRDLGIGKLLVARRDARDPVFAETVILLVHYDHSGTVGLAINRRTNVPISRALREFAGAKERSDPVFMGGPVELQSVLALLKANAMPEGATHVAGKVYLVSTKPLLQKALGSRSESAELRVYLGYCGWGPGQLESETAHGFWHILPAEADLVFDPKPETLWSRLMERVEQHVAREAFPSPTFARWSH